MNPKVPRNPASGEGSFVDLFDGVITEPKNWGAGYAGVVARYMGSAEQGDADAQLKLGAMYASGYGVIEDFVESYKWTLLAGMNGQDVTGFKSSLKKEMTKEQVAEAQKLAKAYVAEMENNRRPDGKDNE